jgi:molecular chaperone GrpE
MSELRDEKRRAREERQAETEKSPAPAFDDEAPDMAEAAAEGPDATFERPAAEPAGEAEILRTELMRLQEELVESRARFEEMRDRFMRARADLENYRKRAVADVERAREAGLDSAVLPVLSVFDDLRRALDAADVADPAGIVPGVQAVMSSLERNLEALGIKPVGNIGEAFDPDIHEALTSVPTDEAERSETIAEVFQLGFRKGDRLIRPARVVVFQS